MNAEVKQALKDGEKLATLIRQAFLTLGPLDADCITAAEHWRKDKTNQFWSRVAIRCLCANIEARFFVYRRTALVALPLSKVCLTKDELEILREEKTVIRNGVTETKRKWLHIKDSVKESMRLFAKAAGASFQPDCSLKGYTAFCDTFDVRNRLMHPKNTFDLGVTEASINTADEAIHWLNTQHANLMEACDRHIKANVEKGLKELRQER